MERERDDKAGKWRCNESSDGIFIASELMNRGQSFSLRGGWWAYNTKDRKNM